MEAKDPFDFAPTFAEATADRQDKFSEILRCLRMTLRSELRNSGIRLDIIKSSDMQGMEKRVSVLEKDVKILKTARC